MKRRTSTCRRPCTRTQVRAHIGAGSKAQVLKGAVLRGRHAACHDDAGTCDTRRPRLVAASIRRGRQLLSPSPRRFSHCLEVPRACASALLSLRPPSRPRCCTSSHPPPLPTTPPSAPFFARLLLSALNSRSSCCSFICPQLKGKLRAARGLSTPARLLSRPELA
eukprot:4470812-Pleurochrysis_carterae.AAC.1